MLVVRLDDLTPDAIPGLADEIRGLGRRELSIEAAAQTVCRLLYESLVGAEGGPAAALVRVYKTHVYAKLEPGQRAFADGLVDEPLTDDVRCLTLLGTAGDEPDWNDRRRSQGHQAIPLPSADFVERIPMVAQLISQLGLDVQTVLSPPSQAAKLAQQRYDVFHVAQAAGSPYLPAQEFVERYGIASAAGFGGILLNGDFYAAIVFSKVALDDATARTLRVLALPLRVALTPIIGRPTFDAP